MDTFGSNFSNNLKLILSMRWSDVLDVLIVAVVIYAVIKFVRRTNATRVAQGVLILLVALWLSSANVLNLPVTSFILRQVFEIGLIAVIILFQPEIRRALERVASYRVFSLFSKELRVSFMEDVIEETVTACNNMSKTRTGALIVFERMNRVNDFILEDPGTAIDAVVSHEILENIFYKGSPLHDGAVIIRDGRLSAAGCMLPLTARTNLSRELGSRHRAGLGISERTDAVVVIISEETGSISVAIEGLLKRHLSPDTFKALLRQELMPKEDESTGRRDWLKGIIGRKNGEKDQDAHK